MGHVTRSWMLSVFTACCICAATAVGLAQAAETAKHQAWAVPTFECLGLYLNRQGDAKECRLQYRKAGDAQWRSGLPLDYDARIGQWRGSLVGLTPDTEYDIRLTCGGDTIDLNGRTRSEKLPIGKTTIVPAGESDQALRITESGASEAWHLVAPAPGTKAVINVFGQSEYCVDVSANYVIVRGLELVNAGQHAVRIRRGVQNVVVEDCHMIRWGRLGGARVWGVTYGSDSGVYAESGAGGLIIQRNLIEHPRSGSNDWESGHPSGPQGISLINSSGGNIIRYNEIRSTEDHGFNDGFGGGENFSFQGSPNCDSDIYGNIITNCWDDAIESEGANRNVRIWSNYIDKTFVFVATASTSMGPLYIFRNVFGESRSSHQDRAGGMIIKTGSRDVVLNGQKLSTGLGRRYIFHNTALQ
ncbi:right-handed parallel beta-helix repeat-containing protein, partial [Candidatus Sumerlaeota bacterium]|nr:right-handed parallel beta-helix repeat-containing protein [Candidatus Sumerlaeota bacterium]